MNIGLNTKESLDDPAEHPALQVAMKQNNLDPESRKFIATIKYISEPILVAIELICEKYLLLQLM